MPFKHKSDNDLNLTFLNRKNPTMSSVDIIKRTRILETFNDSYNTCNR